ncbi:MAG: hypothetical protein ACE5FD_17365, partial [Anaerolineae bacterium]
MSKLIFIRHSKVQIDPARPSHEWPLSADGRARALTLAPQIAAYTPTLNNLRKRVDKFHQRLVLH